MEQLDCRFAEAALRKGLLTWDKARRYLEEARRNRVSFPALIVEKGEITQQQHDEVIRSLDASDEPVNGTLDDDRFCEAVIGRGLLDLNRLLEAMETRDRESKPLDDALVEMGYLTLPQIRMVRSGAPAVRIEVSDQTHSKIGEIALRKGYITDGQLRLSLGIQEVERQRGRERRLGEILLEKGYINTDQLEDILRQQERESKQIAIPGYKILERIGEGAMGEIYKARQLSVDRVVAIKILPRHYAKDQAYMRRFVREAKILAKLNHPAIVKLIDAGQVRDTYFYVMEFVDGVTVQDILDKNGRLPEDECIKVGLAVAQALEHAARHKLVHRDVKPSNIMRTRDGQTKLCDLGIAKLLDATPEEATATQQMAVGTPDYISPEACMGGKVDVRSDIYSLGATLYHCATGRPPFRGPTAESVMFMHVQQAPIPPRELNPGLSPKISDLIMRMMRKAPEERFLSATELVQALEDFTRGAPRPAEEEPSEVIRSTIRMPKMAVNPKVSWKGIVAAVTVTLLLFAAVAIYLLHGAGTIKLPFIK